MFQDLDSTLAAMLADSLGQTTDVDFETPDKNYAPQSKAINLFLYDVKENRKLRDPVPIREQTGDVFNRRMPPLRADCSYLVTTWSDDEGEDDGNMGGE